ncbi:hypothetical protein FRB98_008012 [Tulasnella sp. 332]|nr:hypothetical protein FRB98_008012 [Tulasnella sp. 332]
MSHYHPSLLIEEILLRIFGHLSRSSLAAVAITCCVWSDLASDLLWEDVALRWLLNVLPVELPSQCLDRLRLRRAPTDEDWMRFDRISRRVRRATFEEPMDTTLAMELQRHTNTTKIPILPNIRHLKWDCDYGPSCLFVGPSLHTLHFPHLDARGRKSTGAYPSCLLQIATIAPALTELHISAWDLTEDEINYVAQMLGLLPSLKRISLLLDVTSNSTPVLPVLSKLPELQDLSLYYLTEVPLPWTPSAPNPFPGLRRITLKNPPEEGIIRKYLDNLIPSGKLVAIHIWLGYLSRGWASEVAEILIAAARHSQLQSLRVYASRRSYAPPLSLTLLRPLASCSHLQKLQVWVGGRSKLTDEDIEFLVSHLPQLNRLKLVSGKNRDPLEDDTPVTTLRAIAIVTSWCLQIESITLEVDARASVPYSFLEPHHRIRLVDVRGSPILNSEPVIRFFAALSTMKEFQIVYDDEWDTLQVNLWKEVVEGLRAARA